MTPGALKSLSNGFPPFPVGALGKISSECGVLAKTPLNVRADVEGGRVGNVSLRWTAEGDKPGSNPGLAAVKITWWERRPGLLLWQDIFVILGRPPTTHGKSCLNTRRSDRGMVIKLSHVLKIPPRPGTRLAVLGCLQDDNVIRGLAIQIYSEMRNSPTPQSRQRPSPLERWDKPSYRLARWASVTPPSRQIRGYPMDGAGLAVLNHHRCLNGRLSPASFRACGWRQSAEIRR